MDSRAEIDGVIRTHHDALGAWLAGGDRQELERFLAAHDDEFTLVTVDGDIVDLATLRAVLADAGGSQPTLQIEVDDVRVMVVTDNIAIVRFVETHRHTDEPDQAAQRRTTAVLDGRRGSWRWLTVHETAFDDRRQAART